VTQGATYRGALHPAGPGLLRGTLVDQLGCEIVLTATVIRQAGAATRIDLRGEVAKIAVGLLLPGEPGFVPSNNTVPEPRDPKRDRYARRPRRSKRAGASE
jgi:hypothetical protein